MYTSYVFNSAYTTCCTWVARVSFIRFTAINNKNDY